MIKKKKSWITAIGLFLLVIALIINLSPRLISKPDPRDSLTLEQRIDLATGIAREKVTHTIKELTQSRPLTATDYFPYITRQAPTWQEKFGKNPFKQQLIPITGEWSYGNTKSWAAGAFPGLLWKLQALETDPVRQAFWRQQTKAWSEPLRSQIPTDKNAKDITLNNLVVFQPWYEMSQG